MLMAREAWVARNWKMSKSSRGRGERSASAGRAGNSEPHRQIASKLKALYRTVENEPVPQHFIDLLRRLDEAESAQSGE